MTSRSMRFKEVCREAYRNLSTGTSRGALLALIVSVTGSALAFLDASTMGDIVAQAAEFRSRGSSITILSAESSIDGRACDALSRHAGIRASGAISERDVPLSVAGIPQNPLTFFTATPGFATMLPEATGQITPGILLPRPLAQTLGLQIGQPIHTKDGQTMLGGTYEYPDDGRSRGMGFAAIAPVSPDSSFDQCWLDAYPVSKATIDLLYTTISADSSLPDSGPTLSQHNSSLGHAIDPAQTFSERNTSLAPLAGMLLGATVGFFAVWGRRMEIASALHSGVRRADQFASSLIEIAAWSTAGALTAIPVVAFATQALPEADYIFIVLTALQTPSMTSAGAILGGTIAVFGVREHQLFAYFKGR